MLFYSSQPPSEAGTVTPVQRRRDCWPLRREVMTSSAPAWQDLCGEGKVRIWEILSSRVCRTQCGYVVWGKGVLIMTPRLLAWVPEWMTLPCTDVKGYSDFPSGPFWFAVSGTPKGKSHLKLDMFVWEWAGCLGREFGVITMEMHLSLSVSATCMHAHTPGTFLYTLLHSQKFQQLAVCQSHRPNLKIRDFHCECCGILGPKVRCKKCYTKRVFSRWKVRETTYRNSEESVVKKYLKRNNLKKNLSTYSFWEMLL